MTVSANSLSLNYAPFTDHVNDIIMCNTICFHHVVPLYICLSWKIIHISFFSIVIFVLAVFQIILVLIWIQVIYFRGFSVDWLDLLVCVSDWHIIGGRSLYANYNRGRGFYAIYLKWLSARSLRPNDWLTDRGHSILLYFTAIYLEFQKVPPSSSDWQFIHVGSSCVVAAGSQCVDE